MDVRIMADTRFTVAGTRREPKEDFRQVVCVIVSDIRQIPVAPFTNMV